MDRINLRELIDPIINGNTPATDDLYRKRSELLSIEVKPLFSTEAAG